MTLKRQGKYWYGTTSADLQEEMRRYSRLNDHLATEFAESLCPCGGQAFRLESDDQAGAARRTCVACGVSKLMGDSADFADEAELAGRVCVCDAEVFRLVTGVALYEDSHDVRWCYIGCHCTTCQLVGVFADWKCEAGDAAVFLAEV